MAAEQAATQERAADALEAQVRDADALQALAADAAAVHAATVRVDARAALATAAELGRTTLAATQDRVADDAVRQTLVAILADADAALAATDPTAPQSSPNSSVLAELVSPRRTRLLQRTISAGSDELARGLSGTRRPSGGTASDALKGTPQRADPPA